MLKALIVTVRELPTKNYVQSSTFDATEMHRLCTIAKNYGGGNAVIFATPEFVEKMGPDAIGMPVYGPYALAASPAAGSAPGLSFSFLSHLLMRTMICIRFLHQWLISSHLVDRR